MHLIGEYSFYFYFYNRFFVASIKRNKSLGISAIEEIIIEAFTYLREEIHSKVIPKLNHKSNPKAYLTLTHETFLK